MSEKKDIVFFVADAAMEAVFGVFLKRGHFPERLNCNDFSFDIARDPRSTDGGLYRRAHELLKPYQHTHQRAVVVLDQQFGGELPAAQVQVRIEESLRNSGWSEGDYAVIVIDPELEVWLWQNHPYVQQCLKYQEPQPLRNKLAETGEWPEDCLKPLDPKNCIQQLIRTNRAGVPTVVYTKIASRISVQNCQDDAFQSLMLQLRAWFPAPAVKSQRLPLIRRRISLDNQR